MYSLLWVSTVRIRCISLCINKLLQGPHWLVLMRFKYKSEPKTFLSCHDAVNEQKEQPWTLKRLTMSCVYTQSNLIYNLYNRRIRLVDKEFEKGNYIDACDIIQASQICTRPVIVFLLCNIEIQLNVQARSLLRMCRANSDHRPL